MILLKGLKWLIGFVLLGALGVILAVALKMYLAPSWGDYVAPDKSFEALFPDTPIHEAGPAPFPFVGERNFLTARTDLATYRVSYVNTNPAIKGPAEALMAEAASTLGGKVEIINNAFSLSDQGGLQQAPPQAIDFRISLANGAIVYGRILATNTRLYQLLVSHPFEQNDPPDVRLFFKGFKIRAS